jgi:hypothetical protein
VKLQLVLAASLVTKLGLANVAAGSMPGRAGGNLGATVGTPLAVERERLEISCTERDRSLECGFVAVYVIVNPTSEPVSALAAFWGHAEGVSLSGAGQAQRRLSDGERNALLEAFTARVEDPLSRAPEPQPNGVELHLPARGKVELRATGRFDTGWFGGAGYERPALNARHSIFQPAAPASTGISASYYLASIRSFSSVGPIEVSVRVPSNWTTRLHVESNQGRWTPITSPRATIDARSASFLHLSFERTVGLQPGGPMLAVGGAFGEHGGVRLRAGYEIAAPEWLFYAATFETDGDDHFAVTPLVEAATPQILIVPSLALGVGAPVRIQPDRAVGARIQASLGVWKLGFVTSVDWFPAAEHANSEVALLGTLWL